MRVKLEWLNELVDLTGLSVDEIVKTLSLYSTEVEGVEKVVSGTNLVIGHVLQRVPHPNSDHLSICQVDLGDKVTQIVCGAPNVAQGQYVIVATEGAVLPGDFKIKKSKIRGEESNGMICSLSELGMEKKYVSEEYQAGIYYFTDEVKAGDDPLEKLNLKDEVVELGLTPNRGDLLSMLGVAYEVSAVFKRELKPLAYSLTECDEENEKAVNVTIEDKDCSLYYAKVLKDLQIKKSPTWLQSRLIAFGVRPINNVVDITNYILALFGQPLHAFDYDKLGQNIVVRKAYENEKMVTLDNIERSLLPTDLVITDGKKPVALAGVMGGLDTEITSETKNMVLEVAVFDPITIRKTSSRLNLRSEASTRYEKGIDANRSKIALEYACYLLQTLAGAKVLKGVTVAGKADLPDKEIKITKAYIDKHLGTDIDAKAIEEYFTRLGFKVEGENGEYVVKVPNRRLDITMKDDLVEEVGRLHGYVHLPLTLPATSLAGGRSPYQTNRRKLKHNLIGLGLNEVVNYSLVADNNTFQQNHIENSSDIELLYPLSNDRRILRRSLVPSLLENVSYAYNRKIKDIQIFEVGKTYSQIGDEYYEEEYLAIAIANQFSDTLWQGKTEKADFYLLKGLLEAAFANLGISFTYAPILNPGNELHPLRSATIYSANKEVGYIGTLHPMYAKEKDLQDVWVCEVKLGKLLQVELQGKIYKYISKVPSVERDIAVVVKKDVLASELLEVIKQADKKILSEVKIFDVYEGEKVASDEKSIALKLVFTSNETLTDEVINQKIEKILKQLAEKLHAKLRD